MRIALFRVCDTTNTDRGAPWAYGLCLELGRSGQGGAMTMDLSVFMPAEVTTARGTG